MSKIIDINDRVPERRRKRKIRTNIKFSVLISIFILAMVGLLYFQSSYSKIQTIDVKGAKLVTDDEYIALTGLNIGDSMWSFRVKDIHNKIQKNEWVKEVQLKRNWLTGVSIDITEWPKVAYIEQNYRFVPMLENGYIYEKGEDSEPIDAPLFISFDDEKKREKTLKELAKLKPEVLGLISQINLAATESDPYGIIIYMNDGYEVRADITSFAEKLNYYPSIIAQIEQEEQFEKGIIDIEVGSYYRPFTGEYSNISIEDMEASAEKKDGQAGDQAEEGDDNDE